jgi:hypothetical protein
MKMIVTEGGREPASAFRSPEVVAGLAGRQERQNAEDVSGARCCGGVGMEVGKEHLVQARRKPAALYLLHSGSLSQPEHQRAAALYQTDCGHHGRGAVAMCL